MGTIDSYMDRLNYELFFFGGLAPTSEEPVRRRPKRLDHQLNGGYSIKWRYDEESGDIVYD